MTEHAVNDCFETLGFRSIAPGGGKAATGHAATGILGEEERLTGSRRYDDDHWALVEGDSPLVMQHGGAGSCLGTGAWLLVSSRYTVSPWYTVYPWYTVSPWYTVPARWNGAPASVRIQTPGAGQPGPLDGVRAECALPCTA